MYTLNDALNLKEGKINPKLKSTIK